MTMFGIARPLGNRGRWQSHPYWHRRGDRRVRTLHETFLALIERLTMIREIQPTADRVNPIRPAKPLVTTGAEGAQSDLPHLCHHQK
jgi:hypothetical protein